MRSTFFIVVSMAVLGVCLCESSNKTKSVPAISAHSTAEKGIEHLRARRAIAEQESDLLPSSDDVDASTFGETSQIEGRGRIRVLPAFLG